MKTIILNLLLFVFLLTTACTRTTTLNIASPERPNLVVDGSIIAYPDKTTDIIDGEYNKVNDHIPGFQLLRFSTAKGSDTSKVAAPPQVSNVVVYNINDKADRAEFTYNETITTDVNSRADEVIYTALFTPTPGATYRVEFSYDGDTYYAEEQVPATVVPINEVEYKSQDTKSVFAGVDDDLENKQWDVFVHLDDPESERNNYFWELFYTFDDTTNAGLPVSLASQQSIRLIVATDTFFNGRKDYIKKVSSTDKRPSRYFLYVIQYQVSADYYAFIQQTLESFYSQGGLSSGSHTPSRIKGNLQNETHPTRYAYGYIYATTAYIKKIAVNP